MRGREVVGKTRLGRHYAALVVRDRKSDPVRGLLFAVPEEERGEKDIRSKPIKGRTCVLVVEKQIFFRC